MKPTYVFLLIISSLFWNSLHVCASEQNIKTQECVVIVNNSSASIEPDSPSVFPQNKEEQEEQEEQEIDIQLPLPKPTDPVLSKEDKTPSPTTPIYVVPENSYQNNEEENDTDTFEQTDDQADEQTASPAPVQESHIEKTPVTEGPASETSVLPDIVEIPDELNKAPLLESFIKNAIWFFSGDTEKSTPISEEDVKKAKNFLFLFICLWLILIVAIVTKIVSNLKSQKTNKEGQYK